MPTPTAKELTELYGLMPHPEGGFFKETYRAREAYKSLPEPFNGPRNYSTAIFFLLPKGAKSALHRIAADEVWHFYLGGPLTLVQISPTGECEMVILGANVKKGEKLQHVVPAGYWFGAHPSAGSDYSFVGCTVSPGFDFADFEMGNRTDLTKRYPAHKAVIERLSD